MQRYCHGPAELYVLRYLDGSLVSGARRTPKEFTGRHHTAPTTESAVMLKHLLS